jgi:hypothetical protein
MLACVYYAQAIHSVLAHSWIFHDFCQRTPSRPQVSLCWWQPNSSNPRGHQSTRDELYGSPVWANWAGLTKAFQVYRLRTHNTLNTSACRLRDKAPVYQCALSVKCLSCRPVGLVSALQASVCRAKDFPHTCSMYCNATRWDAHVWSEFFGYASWIHQDRGCIRICCLELALGLSSIGNTRRFKDNRPSLCIGIVCCMDWRSLPLQLFYYANKHNVAGPCSLGIQRLMKILSWARTVYR